MNKIELIKCEKVLNEAIANMKGADKLYAEEKANGNDCKYLTPKIRMADNKRGYAEGINQALAMVGYNSEKMKELSDLL